MIKLINNLKNERKDKMNRKVKTLMILALIFSLLLSGCGGNTTPTQASSTTQGNQSTETPAEPINITFADYGNSAMAPADAYRYAIEYISEKSNGRIIIDYIPNAVLGNETEMIQQLMDGTTKMATLGTSTFSLYTDKLEAFQIPFLITDYEIQQKAFNSPEGKALLAESETYGIKIVGFAENGIRHFANNIRPVNTPSDLNGLKLRIVPSQMLRQSMELLGANPTPLNYGEIYTALQNKVIDGMEINITSMYAMKHYEVIKYVSEIGMYPFPAVVCFNLDFWNSLSQADQDLITEGFAEGTKKLFEEYLPNFEEVARKACDDIGIEFNVIEDREAFRQLVLPVYDDYKARDPKIAAFIDAVLSFQ